MITFELQVLMAAAVFRLMLMHSAVTTSHVQRQKNVLIGSFSRLKSDEIINSEGTLAYCTLVS
jgi:hypothetical protein